MITESERLIIRPWTINDAQAYYDIYSDPEVKRYLEDTGGLLESIELAKKYIEHGITFEKKHGFYLWAVETKHTQTVVGNCGFLPIEKDVFEVEMSYHFAQKYWGQGYASEASKACLDYAQKHLNFKILMAYVHPENLPSIKILENLGFEYSGMDEGDKAYIYPLQSQ